MYFEGGMHAIGYRHGVPVVLPIPILLAVAAAAVAAAACSMLLPHCSNVLARPGRATQNVAAIQIAAMSSYRLKL